MIAKRNAVGRLPGAGTTCRIPATGLVLLAVAGLIVACAGDYARKRAERYYLQGQQLVNRGETERAIHKFEKSMVLAEKTGFEAGVAHNLNELAIIHTNRGEFDAARGELNRALGIYQSLDMKPEVSKTLNNIVQTYIREGRFQAAMEHYQRLLEWDEKSGNRLGVAISLYNMALIYDRHLGDPRRAREAYQRAMTIFNEPGNRKYLETLKGE